VETFYRYYYPNITVFQLSAQELSAWIPLEGTTKIHSDMNAKTFSLGNVDESEKKSVPTDLPPYFLNPCTRVL
jgi:hypothetical protein